MAIAIIGGSGFYAFPQLQAEKTIQVKSPYSDKPVNIIVGEINNTTVYFLARHGRTHSLPPHKINYRANIDALSSLGVQHIVAINAVGGIYSSMGPSTLVIPDQVIDYTWGREQTFFDEFSGELNHIDFSYPLESPLREKLINPFKKYLNVVEGGVYGCTQGPRLESAAEIRKLKADGCDVVGMTMMPEAALAREKSMSYLSVCIVCNWAAGLDQAGCTDHNKIMAPLSIEEIKAVLAAQLTKVQAVLADSLTLL